MSKMFSNTVALHRFSCNNTITVDNLPIMEHSYIVNPFVGKSGIWTQALCKSSFTTLNDKKSLGLGAQDE
jgi:hypothetical protein